MNRLNRFPRRSLAARAIFLVLLMLSSIAAEAAMTAAEAVNVSGRQRMLSQRIAKAYLMVGAGVDVAEAQKQLDDAVALFERQHQALSDYAPTPQIRTALGSVEQAWFPYRELVLMPADKKSAQRAVLLSEQVLAAAETTVTLIQENSGKSAGKLVNMAGRQRMLSQRIAKYYLAMYWQVENVSAESQFLDAMKQFDTALATLQAARENTPVIRMALDKVASQWRFSKAGFQQYRQGRYVPTVIGTTTDTMLRQMNDITAQYEAVMQGAK